MVSKNTRPGTFAAPRKTQETRTTAFDGPVCLDCERDAARPADAEFDYVPLDPGIVVAVRAMRDAGVETLWSCEGGEGHSFRSPTVIFRGDNGEARRVVEICRQAHLGPCFVRRRWPLWGHLADWDVAPSLSGVAPEEIFGQWEVEFAQIFAADPIQAAAHHLLLEKEKSLREQHQKPEEQRALFQELLQLEPRLMRLFQEVEAGVISLDDVWLTYFCCRLDQFIGVARKEEGPKQLFTDEAFTAALVNLHRHQGGIEAVRRGEGRAGGLR